MGDKSKTNAMRILAAEKIPFKEHYYADTGAVSGLEVAAALNEEPSRVFKTLVTVGKSGNNYVFMMPVDRELDLKKAAAAAGEKNISMLASASLFALTGYVHGGCSPIGMKKRFKTFIDKSAAGFETIYCSGGKIGFQLELSPFDLEKAVKLEFADL